MKSLAALALSCLFFVGISCSDDSNEIIDDGTGTGTGNEQQLDQTEIRQKVADYYSTPAAAAQAVATIQTAFDDKFPGATDVEWKSANNVYEIEFDLNRVDHKAWYDNNANLLMYKHDVANTEVPQVVTSATTTDYPDYILDDAEKVYKGEIIGYYLELKKNKAEVNAFYNENGTFISKNIWEDDNVKPEQDAGTSTPEISGSITDEDADALLAAYYSARDTDVNPANVPTAITSHFAATFPNAHDIDWELSAGVYKVDFEIYNVDYDAWYREDGTILTYKFDITRSSLPQTVTTAIQARFADYQLDDAEKVIKPNSTGYWVELESRYTEEDAYFTEDGTYVSDSFYQSNSGSVVDPDPIVPEIPIEGDLTDVQIDELLQGYYQGRENDIQASRVPAAITAAFSTQFVSARDIEWEVSGDVYSVEFEIGNTDYEAWYYLNGSLLMYKQDIRYSEINATVMNMITSQYSDYVIDGSEAYQKGTTRGYIIELENRRTDAEITIMCLEDGTIVTQYRD